MQATLDEDFLFLLYDVARTMRTRADQRARTRGMTRAQWVILARLERQPGLTQNEMAAIVEVEPITIARLVDRLEARGLVVRKADPRDRRVWRLHLTPAAAPILRLKRDYRYHFVLKSPSREKLNRLLRSMLTYAATQGIPRTQVIVDVDALWLM